MSPTRCASLGLVPPAPIDDGADRATDDDVRAGQAAGVAELDVWGEVDALRVHATPSELHLDRHADVVDLADDPIDASGVRVDVCRDEG